METKNEEVEEPKPKEKAEEEEGDAPQEQESSETAIGVATKLRDSIKAENDRHEALIVRQENLAAQNMLGGQSNAGQAPPKKESEDEKWEREAKVRYEGTGLDPTPSGDESGF